MQIQEIGWLPESKVRAMGVAAVNIDLLGTGVVPDGGTWNTNYTYLYPYSIMQVPRNGRLVAIQFKCGAIAATHKLQFFLLYAHGSYYDVMAQTEEYVVPVQGAGWRKYLVDIPVTAGWYLAVWFDTLNLYFAPSMSGYYLYRHAGKVSGLNNTFPETYPNTGINLRGAVAY